MKHFITLLLFGLGYSLQAQTKVENALMSTGEPRHFQYQLGFNATDFIKTFIVPNNYFSGATSPYTFQGKILYTKTGKLSYGLRTGVGYTDNRSANFNSINQTENSNEQTTLDYRIGFELQQYLTPRWSIYYGLDYVWEKSEQSYISSNSNYLYRTASYTHKTGFGPVIGVQFKVSKFLYLGTELSFYLTTFNGNSKLASYSNNNGYKEWTEMENGRNGQITPPAMVNITFVY